jgi:hypothetical protein
MNLTIVVPETLEDSDSEHSHSSGDTLTGFDDEDYLGVVQHKKEVGRSRLNRKESRSDDEKRDESASNSPRNRSSLASIGHLIRNITGILPADNLGFLSPNKRRKVVREIEDGNNLDSHVIVFGNMTNILIFVAELRRPIVCEIDFHPILGNPEYSR